ncbi:MAG: hypothetical protein HA494_06030 [Thaumarchaeota archaeon]|nr:hypothetical protein [Nitrososphaerota archaeon]
MPFLIDDIILRMVGISLPPFDMLWLLETIRDYAIQELYNPEKIGDELKEAALLYDLGEITKEEYERRYAELTEKLKIAQRVRESNIIKRVDILNVGV